MKRSVDRILTTHVGSLIRPPQLLELTPPPARATRRRRPLAAGLRDATADVVRRQAQAGMDIVNDGEYGKSSWANYVLDRMTGFEFRPDTRYEPVWLGRDRVRFAEFMSTEFPRGAKGCRGTPASGRSRYTGHDGDPPQHRGPEGGAGGGGRRGGLSHRGGAGEHRLRRVRRVLPRRARLRVRDRRGAARGVPRDRQRRPGAAGGRRGARQHVRPPRRRRAASQRYRRWAELRIEALNHALRGIPEDRVRYHICFGSWHVPHVADAPLDAIVDLMLTVNAGAYSIEAANVRHEHEWRVWQTVKLPRGPDAHPRRRHAPHHHRRAPAGGGRPPDSLRRPASAGRTSSPAPTAASRRSKALQRVHPQVMWAKLEALAEGARLASKALWGRQA